MKKIAAVVLLTLVFAPATLFAKQTKLTTYYPAPYGDYKELNTYEMKLQPTDTPNDCVAAREGALYYDLSEHTMKQCVYDPAGDRYVWATMTANLPELTIARGVYQGLTLPANTNYQNLNLSGVSGGYVTNKTTYIQVDIKDFPKGFYELQWAYNVDVKSTVASSKGVYLYLERKNESLYGTWNVIDSVFLEDDIDNDSVATNHADTRVLQFAMKPSTNYDKVDFRIRAKKTSANGNYVQATINAGAYIEVIKF